MIGVNSLKSLIVGSNKGNIVGKGEGEEVRVGVCYFVQDQLEGGGTSENRMVPKGSPCWVPVSLEIE